MCLICYEIEIEGWVKHFTKSAKANHCEFLINLTF